MLGGEEPKALGGLWGIEEMMDRMNGDAERIEAEDEHKTEDYCPSGSSGDPMEHEDGKEKERSQHRPRLDNVMGERPWNTNIDRVRTLRGWVMK
jgi:hypothetical protein